MYACGGNAHGELGLGEGKTMFNQDHPKFVKIPGLSDVRDIACGWEFSIACTRSAGEAYTFGHPQYGQLGLGATGELTVACVYLKCHYLSLMV